MMRGIPLSASTDPPAMNAAVDPAASPSAVSAILLACDGHFLLGQAAMSSCRFSSAAFPNTPPTTRPATPSPGADSSDHERSRAPGWRRGRGGQSTRCRDIFQSVCCFSDRTKVCLVWTEVFLDLRSTGISSPLRFAMASATITSTVGTAMLGQVAVGTPLTWKWCFSSSCVARISSSILVCPRPDFLLRRA